MCGADRQDGEPPIRFTVDAASHGYTTGRRAGLLFGDEQPLNLFQMGRVNDALALAEAQFTLGELPTGPFPGAFEAFLERFAKDESEGGEMGPRHIAAMIIFRAAELREIEAPIEAGGRDEVSAFGVLQLSRIGFQIGALFTELRWKLAHEENARKGAAALDGAKRGAELRKKEANAHIAELEAWATKREALKAERPGRRIAWRDVAISFVEDEAEALGADAPIEDALETAIAKILQRRKRARNECSRLAEPTINGTDPRLVPLLKATK